MYLSLLKATSKDVFLCICIFACSSPSAAVMYVCDNVLFKHKPTREVPLGNYIALFKCPFPPIFILFFIYILRFKISLILEPCMYLEPCPFLRALALR